MNPPLIHLQLISYDENDKVFAAREPEFLETMVRVVYDECHPVGGGTPYFGKHGLRATIARVLSLRKYPKNLRREASESIPEKTALSSN